MAYLQADVERIKWLMAQKGYSQLKLAVEAQVSPGTIEHMFHGRHRSNTNTAKRVANALDVDVSDIFHDPNAAISAHAGPLVHQGAGLPTTLGEHFIGRTDALAALNGAWQSAGTHVVSLVGVGGIGKTALVKRWLDLNAPDYGGAERVFIWSFAGQAGDAASDFADELINDAWRFFCSGRRPKPWRQAASRLGDAIAGCRALVVFDGIERFLTPPGTGAGHFRPDDPILTLLSRLASHNLGLCVVTSRIPLEDFAASRSTTTPQIDVGRLSPGDGASLLQDLGIEASPLELQATVDALWGHPLSLTLLGGYLRDLQESGGLASWRHDLAQAADAYRGGVAERIMLQYEVWLNDPARLAILCVLALHEAAVDFEALDAFRSNPALGPETGPITTLDETRLRLALSELHRACLLARDAFGRWDLHPLVRRHFRKRLSTRRPDEWRSAHALIYQRLLAVTDEEPASHNELVPLYPVIEHGCAAGLYQACFDEVVWKRLLQGFPAVSVHSFNVGGLDLVAVLRFFEGGRPRPAYLHATIDCDLTRGRLCWWAGLVLRIHGRTNEATDLFDAAHRAFAASGDLVGEASALAYASRCMLSAGRVAEAVEKARAATDVVERDLLAFGRQFLRAANIGRALRSLMELFCRAQDVPIYLRIVTFPLADALHNAGQLDEAMRIFTRGARSPLPPAMHAWDIFVAQDAMHYDLLLSLGEDDEVEQRARTRLKRVADARLPNALMTIMLERVAIRRLGDSNTIEAIAARLRLASEELDYRTGYHYTRAFIELAAAARGVGELETAGQLLAEARDWNADQHWQLGEVDLMLEEAAQALACDRVYPAWVKAKGAQELMVEQGYGLRAEAVGALLDGF